MLNISAAIGEQLSETTEAAAMAAAAWIGCGDKNAACLAAAGAIASQLQLDLEFGSVVVIGNRDKDQLPLLANGEEFGCPSKPLFDLAVNPIDNSAAVANNRQGGISALALGKLLPWSGIAYMNKLVAGQQYARLFDNGDVRLDSTPYENIVRLATHTHKSDRSFTVAVLDRPRNRVIIDAVRQASQQLTSVRVNLKLLKDGDIIPAIQTSLDTRPEIDVLYGSGGTSEAVLAAAGVAALGGCMQAGWLPTSRAETARADDLGQYGKVLDLADLVGSGELHFAMTAITSYGNLLNGCGQLSDGSWASGTTYHLFRAGAPSSRQVGASNHPRTEFARRPALQLVQ